MNNSAKSIFEMSHNVWKKGYADRHESWLLYYRHIKNCMTGLQRVSKEFKCRVQTEFKSEYCNKLRGWGRVGSVETMVKSKDSLVSFLSSTSRRISHSLFYRALWVFIISYFTHHHIKVNVWYTNLAYDGPPKILLWQRSVQYNHCKNKGTIQHKTKWSFLKCIMSNSFLFACGII